MEIQFLGGARTVTGSCYLIDTGDYKILVDCGMFQGRKQLEELNQVSPPVNPHEISAVVLTHAHIDHSGLIPKFCKDGYKGPIYTSSTTVDLCSIMLPDSGHIQELETEWFNRKRKRKGRSLQNPLYTEEDARKSLRQFEGIEYQELKEILPGITLRFQDAGHILGSSIIEIWIENGEKVKLVFSGDLGNPNQAIVKDPSMIEEADYVFIESTYGDRLHKKTEDPKKILGEIIRTVQKDGGNIIIPSFAVGRTQEIIYNLTELLQGGEIAPLPVFIDSPLAIEATKIFQENTRVFDEESHEHINKGIDPLSFPGLQFIVTPEESQKLNRITSGAIIISASGMCEAGRIKHHLKHHLWRQKSHIVFVGYQAEGTLGRRLVDGTKRVRIFGEEIKVAAHIHNIEGYSAHADKNELLNWLSSFKTKIKEVFVVHGEEKVSLSFAEEIRSLLDMSVDVPVRMEKVMLEPSVVSMEWQVEDQPELTLEFLHVLKGLEENLSVFKEMIENKELTSAQKQLLADRLDQYLDQLNDLAEDCEENNTVL